MTRLLHRLGRSRWGAVTLAGAGVLGALAARWAQLPFESRDYQSHLSEWWRFLRDNGGFSALRFDFSDYNTPYLYLLAAGSYLDPWVRDLTVIKGISTFFDFLLAFFVFLAVRLRRPAPSLLPIGAALAVLFAPPVLMNSASRGQADAIYTAFLAGTLYFLLARRRVWAFTFFGLAFSFKLQAIFFAPVLVWLLLKGEARWREALPAPLVYLLLLVPAWWIGRPLGDLFSIYAHQITRSHGLVFHAQTLYQWIPPSYAEWAPVFVGAAAIALLLITDFLVRSRQRIGERLELLAAFTLLLVPWILPHMRERYFYPAEALSVVFASFHPRYWFVPIGLWLMSYATYLGYPAPLPGIPIVWRAAGVLALLVVLGLRVFREFRNHPASPGVENADIGPALAAPRPRPRWWQFPRAPIWCAIVLLVAASTAYGRHLMRFHRAVEERIEAAGPPVISSQWAVYLEERLGARSLLYHQRECPDIGRDRFVLHLYPVDPDRLAPTSRSYGYSVHNFGFEEREVTRGRDCVAAVPLPDYPLSAIVTGQTRRRRDGSLRFLWLHGFHSPEATAPSVPTDSGRLDGPLDPDRYRTPLSALAAGDWGAPVGRSRFGLHFDGTGLRYHKEPCGLADVRSKFFLYLRAPSDAVPAGEPLNRDFDFFDYGVVEDRKCLAFVPVPDGYAEFDTGQWTPTLFWRVRGRLDRARYRTALDSYASGEWGAPIVRSDFDLYLQGNELRYYRAPCEPAEVETGFFLQLHRSSSRPDSGEPVHLNFDFYERGVIEDGKCLAIVSLPTGGGGYASLETGQYGEAASWRVKALLDRERHREALGSLARGEWGAPDAQADFDLYLADDELRYVREPCGAPEVEARFFLHLHGLSPATGPDSSGKPIFENRDFDFAEYGVLEDGRCLALVPLPDTPVDRIVTGQFVGREPRIWQAELLPAKRRLESRLQAIAAGELDPPVARSTFDLYLEETALLFHRRSCSESELEERFFLHLYPEDTNDLPAARKSYGFENRDFSFLDRGFQFGEECLARVPLPDYPFARLRTGQFSSGGEPSWSVEARPGSPGNDTMSAPARSRPRKHARDRTTRPDSGESLTRPYPAPNSPSFSGVTRAVRRRPAYSPSSTAAAGRTGQRSTSRFRRTTDLCFLP